MAIGIAEAWKLRDCFRFGVDGLPPAILVLTPVRDQTPTKPVKCSLSGLWVLSDNPVLLARSTIVVRGHMEGLDNIRDVETKLVRSRLLSEASAHGKKIRPRARSAKIAALSLRRIQAHVPNFDHTQENK